MFSKIIFLIIYIFFIGSPFKIVECVEYKGLSYLLNFISNEFMDSKSKSIEQEDYPISLGNCDDDFVKFIKYPKFGQCVPTDINLDENLDDKSQNKKEMRFKCVKGIGNNTLQIVESLKDVTKLLSIHGNSTSRSLPGNCALILFYGKSCPGSAIVAPHFNAIAKQFPDIRIAAIDAFRFHSLNTEFGIIGLPTIMLFHQGRPVVRFNETTYSFLTFIKFIDRHTGIQPLQSNVFVISEDFKGPLSSQVEKETDLCLYLAWAFIFVCSAYYFTKSRLFSQIIEMIKRNWRESEARHEAPQL